MSEGCPKLSIIADQATPQPPPTINATNIAGMFEIIEESTLTDAAIAAEFDPGVVAKSWIIVVERVEDTDGTFMYWNIII
jgi:hypothetical protein